MTNAGTAGQAAPAPYYVVFDVDVRDAPRYGEYMARVLPQIEAAAASTWRAAGCTPYMRRLVAVPARAAGVPLAGGLRGLLPQPRVSGPPRAAR